MEHRERQVYENKTQQLLTFAVLLVGKNTIFKFPYLLFVYGGGNTRFVPVYSKQNASIVCILNPGALGSFET